MPCLQILKEKNVAITHKAFANQRPNRGVAAITGRQAQTTRGGG